jgi:hypothetical protein
MLPVPAIRRFACLLCAFIAVISTACSVQSSGPQLVSPVAGPAPASAERLQAARRELATAPVPSGVDPALFEQLRGALDALLGDRIAGRGVSQLPDASRGTVEDLALTENETGELTLSWSYRNGGDYSSDGEVNISDITPVGQHFGKTSAAADWNAASSADGDGNGEVNLGDITPIGAGFLNQVSGYNVYGADTPEGPWTLVNSVPLAEATSGFPRRFTVTLPTPGADYYTVAPYDPGGADAINIVSAAAPTARATFQPGTTTVDATSTVGASGGTLNGATGSPLEGVVLTIPAGAFEADVELSLGYNDGTVTPVVGTQHGPIIELATDFDGDAGFEQPLTITVPFSADDGSIPIPYYINSDGSGLEPCDIVGLDSVAGTMTFVTWHASAYAVIRAALADPFAPSYDSKFDPAEHGFQRVDNATGCAVFANWHYRSRRTPLYNRFMGPVDGVLTGQHVIARRAVNSFGSAYPAFIGELRVQNDLLNGEQRWALIRSILQNSGGPVLLCLLNEDQVQFTLVAFAYVGNDLFVYDAALPGETQTIHYDSGSQTLAPYGGLSTYTTLGSGSAAHREPFANILRDAEAYFHGSTQAKIDLGTFTDGDVILVPNLRLQGTVDSGLYFAERIEVNVSTAPGQVGADLGPGGAFDINVPLKPGENKLLFYVYGRTAKGHPVRLTHNFQNKLLLAVGDFVDPGPGEIKFKIELTWLTEGYPPAEYDLAIGERNNDSEIVFVHFGKNGNSTTPWGAELIAGTDGGPEVYEVTDNDLALRPDDMHGIVYKVYRTDGSADAPENYVPYTLKFWYYNDPNGPPYSSITLGKTGGEAVSEPDFTTSQSWGF